jgi:hypothetical protein
MDNAKGFLEVGLNERDEIVVNHPDLKPDAFGVGHIVFSPEQARYLATLLNKNAMMAESNARLKQEAAQREAAEAIPVDRSARVLTNSLPESAMPDYRETDSTGMQKAYVVLSEEERAKGFVRPLRRTYRHIGRSVCGEIQASGKLGGIVRVCTESLEHGGDHWNQFQELAQPDAARASTEHLIGGCNSTTTMGISIAETYARDPGFYGGTFCATCRTHFPLVEFVWEGTTEQVGS